MREIIRAQRRREGRPSLLVLVFFMFHLTANAEGRRRTAKVSGDLEGLFPRDDSSSSNSVDSGERVCMKKVVTEETIEYDQEERCHHVTQENCYQSFKTVYKPVKVEKCKEKIRKDCTIEMVSQSQSVVVEECDDGFKRDCSRKDVEVCSIKFRLECHSEEDDLRRTFEVEDEEVTCVRVKERVCGRNSRGEETCRDVPKKKCSVHKVKRNKVGGRGDFDSPAIECKNVPYKSCRPVICPRVKGDPVCRNKTRFVTQEVPKENCNLVPVRSCSSKATSIVPSLEQEEKCVEEPKEVCTKSMLNPRPVKKPVIRWWCSSPSQIPLPSSAQGGGGEVEGEGDIEGGGGGEIDEEGDKNFEEAFQLPENLEETEETFEFYSHFLMLNGAAPSSAEGGRAAIVTFDSDLVNCPLQDFEGPHMKPGMFGMLLDEADTMRVCGIRKDVEDDGTLSCMSYDAATRSFSGDRGEFVTYGQGAGRESPAVVEIAPEIYWVTGGILANEDGSEATDTTVLLRDGIAEAGPRLPLQLHSHCIVRVNATRFFLHGGKTETDSDPSGRAFLFDAQRRRFSELPGSSAGFSGHVCGVVREGGLRVLAVGGGEGGKLISSFQVSEYDGDPEDEDFDGTLVDVMEWGDLGEFPHEGEGLGGAIRKWQMEDTFMVLGLPSADTGKRDLVYEFETFEERFLLVDTTGDLGATPDTVVMPVPPGVAETCLANSGEGNGEGGGGFVRRRRRTRKGKV